MPKNLVLILGAGLSGMSAAFELSKVGIPLIVVEKNDDVGGLARTFRYGKFLTDVGPHRFFSKNKYLYDFILDLLGKDWILVNRLTRFYVKGKFFLYPVELKDALMNIGLYTGFKIIEDFLTEKVKKIFTKHSPRTFEELIISDFGYTLASLNMLNYTEKIWGLPCSEISPDWAKQRIRGLSLKEIIKNAIIKSRGGPKTLVNQFYYPRWGTGQICRAMQSMVKEKGSIQLNSKPSRIIWNDNKIKEVSISIAEGEQVIKPKYLISSIPITLFVNLLEPKPPTAVLEASKHLRFRSHVTLFVTINRQKIFPDQWIYLPEKEIPFGRIMEPKNFSRALAPKNKTSLLIEFFCWENDKIWCATKEELFEISIDFLNQLGFLRKKEVIDYFVHRERHAYPVYDLKYTRYLNKIKGFLEKFENLQCIGRSGCFKYNNQDHALEMGILAARGVIEGKKYNIEDVGSEQEYFEKGYVPLQKHKKK